MKTEKSYFATKQSSESCGKKGETMTSKEYFDGAFEECKEKYDAKKAVYGDSWREMPVEQLWERLDEELQELKSAQYDHEEEARGELIDVVNVSLMLIARLRDTKRSSWADQTTGEGFP